MAEGDACVICGGIEGDSPTGGMLDEKGVCITCQPCPRCGEVDPPYDSDCPERAWH